MKQFVIGTLTVIEQQQKFICLIILYYIKAPVYIINQYINNKKYKF